MGLNIEKNKKKAQDAGFIAGEKVRTTMWMDQNKRDQLKLIAVKNKQTLSSLLDEGLDMLLKKYMKK